MKGLLGISDELIRVGGTICDILVVEKCCEYSFRYPGDEQYPTEPGKLSGQVVYVV